MEKQVERLKESQTALTAGSQWTLTLRGDALRADRLLEMENLSVPPAPGLPPLFNIEMARLKAEIAWRLSVVTAAANRR